MASMLYEMLKHRAPEDASVHLHMRDLIESVYPLQPGLLDLVHTTESSTGRSRRTTCVTGSAKGGGGTGYPRALLSGDDPDADPESRVQGRYAGAYLRAWAMLQAIRHTIGTAEYAKIEDHVLTPTFWTQRRSSSKLAT